MEEYAEAHGNYNQLKGRPRYAGFSLFIELGCEFDPHYDSGGWNEVPEEVAHKISLLASPHYKTLWKVIQINENHF